MNIRKLNVEDYSEIYNLWQNTSGMALRAEDDSKEGIERFIKRNPDTNFIAKIDNTVVGVILCGYDGRRAYIYHMAVKPGVRMCGIGRALVSEVIKVLRAENISKVALVVMDDNSIGNGFWEHIGFCKRDDLIYRDRAVKLPFEFKTR